MFLVWRHTPVRPAPDAGGMGRYWQTTASCDDRLPAMTGGSVGTNQREQVWPTHEARS